LVDTRIGMTKQIGPPRADAVEIGVSFVVIKPNTLTASDGNKWQSLVMFHLSAGVPYRGQTPVNPVF